MTRRSLLVVLGGTMLAIQLVSPAAAQNRQTQAPASPTQSQGMQDMVKMHEQMIWFDDSTHTYAYLGYYKILSAIHN